MRWLSRLLPLPLLAGCAVHLDEVEPLPEVEIPPRWTAAPPTEGASDSGQPWWRTFSVPELDRIVAEALERNGDLEAAAAAVDAAIARARIAGADLAPGVGLALDGSKREQIFFGIPIPGRGDFFKSRSQSFGAVLNVSWEVDLWGRLRAGTRAAIAEVRAVEIDHAAARLSLAAQTAKAYFALLEARQQLVLAEATLGSHRLTAERVEARYRRGLVPPLDLRLAQANRARTAAALEQRRRLLDAVHRQLEALSGRYPSATADGGVELPPVPTAPPPGLPSDLVERRPDLAAAAVRLVAAGLRIEEARRAFFPTVTLTGSGGTSSAQLGDLLDRDLSIWSLAVSVAQAIFQGGRRRAGVRLTEAELARQLAAFFQAHLEALAEVESALAAEGYLAAQELAVGELVDASRAAARLAEDRYLAGIGGFLAVLEGQRQAFDAERELLALHRARLDTRVDLHLALGGGFEASAGESAARDKLADGAQQAAGS